MIVFYCITETETFSLLFFFFLPTTRYTDWTRWIKWHCSRYESSHERSGKRFRVSHRPVDHAQWVTRKHAVIAITQTYSGRGDLTVAKIARRKHFTVIKHYLISLVNAPPSLVTITHVISTAVSVCVRHRPTMNLLRFTISSKLFFFFSEGGIKTCGDEV